MSALSKGQEIAETIWKLYFQQKKSKMEIHNETCHSRVTIDKYIKFIESFISKEKPYEESENFPLEEEHTNDMFPKSYTQRKKRVLTDSVIDAINEKLESKRKS